LFEDLWIYDKWDWTQQFPIIRIDWTQIAHAKPKEMEKSMCRNMLDKAENCNIKLKGETSCDLFSELIEKLHETTGKKVVILIDEYDKPITSHLFDEYLIPVKTAVHDFYQVMKGADEHIQFIFLTGVSKFSGLSVFSALNNLDDITMNSEFATICGYTQDELESHFPEYVDLVSKKYNWAQEKILDTILLWYDGYSWDGGTRVYNPFSTLKFFSDKLFNDYWFNTGSPTFMLEILKRREKTEILLENITVNSTILDGYDPQTLEEIPLFFQTGYLTVKDMSFDENGAYYTLGVPNREVNKALLCQLLLVYGQYGNSDVDILRQKIEKSIRDCDEAAFTMLLETLVATISNELKLNSEAHYHALLLIWLRFIGFEIHPEKSNNFGRADAVWKQSELTVVAELKYSKTVSTEVLLDKAMTQIHEKKYYNPYLGKILLLGVAFAGTDMRCKMEVLER
jgi:hypothetical protein